MAKRQRDTHNEPYRMDSMAHSKANETRPPGYGQNGRFREQRGSRYQDPNQLAKRARLNKETAKKTDLEIARESKAQFIQGNTVRGASLLIQLLNEFAGSDASLNELRALIGDEASEQAMKLHHITKSKEKTVKGRLHSLPKLPESEHSISVFPSRLPDAFDLTVPSNAHTVPPLPPIGNAALAEKPFVHRSFFTNDHKRAVSDSYERLELLGDAYIEVIATRLLYLLYPNLPAGRLSSIREKLVCNETLAAFSLAYDFAPRVKVPETYLDEGSSRAKIWTKLLGDVFEAYVAAVIVDDAEHGFETAETWLRKLWAPRLPEAHVVTDPDKTAKQELQKRLGGVGVKIVYESEKDPEPYRGGLQWFIKCSLFGWGFEGQLLGRSTGRSKQVAELSAAVEAMSNPLTAQAQAIKLKYDEKVRKEREDAALRDATGQQDTGVEGSRSNPAASQP